MRSATLTNRAQNWTNQTTTLAPEIPKSSTESAPISKSYDQDDVPFFKIILKNWKFRTFISRLYLWIFRFSLHREGDYAEISVLNYENSGKPMKNDAKFRRKIRKVQLYRLVSTSKKNLLFSRKMHFRYISKSFNRRKNKIENFRRYTRERAVRNLQKFRYKFCKFRNFFIYFHRFFALFPLLNVKNCPSGFSWLEGGY